VSLSRAFITAAVVLALCSQGRSDPAPVIHYAPIENLEHVDVDLFDRANSDYPLPDPCRFRATMARTAMTDLHKSRRIFCLERPLAWHREPARG